MDAPSVKVMPVNAESFGVMLEGVNKLLAVHLAGALARCKQCLEGVICRDCFESMRAADLLKASIQTTLDDIEAIVNTMRTGVKTEGSA